MKKIDHRGTEEILVSGVMTMSGIRPLGKGTECRAGGRASHGLLYLRFGKACFWCEGQPMISLERGEVLYLPKHQRYRMQYTEEDTSFVLVNFELLSEDGEELALSDEITVLMRDESTGRIDKILSDMEACGLSRDVSSMLRRQELMYRLLGAIYSGDSSLLPHEQRYPQIAAGTRLLERSYLENLPISRFSEESNISLSSFRSLFVKQYGLSPVQYRNRLRLERAERLLAEGTYTVSEVAYACGFENVGYFCRYYKKVLGIAPGEMKKQNRK